MKTLSKQTMKNTCGGGIFSDCVKDVALPLLWTLPYLSLAGVVLCYRITEPD